MNDRELAIKILEYVGGNENISSVAHCVTRLRFKLVNEDIANDEAVKELNKVQGLVKKGGQYQVVLGPGIVDRIYDETLALTGLSGGVVQAEEEETKLSAFDYFIDLVSGVFTPVLGLMAASGMIKGLAVLLASIGLIENGGDTFVIINGIGDAFFAFMPIILGYYAMQKFKGTPMLGAILGAVLVYPAFTALADADSIGVLFEGTIFASQIKSSFFGIPLIMPFGGYASSVIPIIGITYFAAKMEHVLKRKIPDSVQMFLLPMIVILVMSILGLLIIGPILSTLQALIGTFFFSLQRFSPVVYGFVLAGVWQVLVIFGLHWAVIPLMFIDLAGLQAGTIDSMFSLSPAEIPGFVAIGAVLAIYFRTNDKNLKQLALPSFITGIFGITEPALYGIILPRKKVFITTCVISAFFGGFIGLFYLGTYQMAGLGVFALPGFLDPSITGLLNQRSFLIMTMLMILATIVSFLIVYFYIYREDDVKTKEAKVHTPVEGDLIMCKQINDEVFKSEVIGKTIAIKPKSNIITAPVNGKIESIFPTKHAIGIRSTDGVEVLIHVGINTVELAGEPFKLLKEAGDQIKVGEPILEVDFAKITTDGYDDTVIIVITNSNDFDLIEKTESSNIAKNDVILTTIGGNNE